MSYCDLCILVKWTHTSHVRFVRRLTTSPAIVQSFISLKRLAEEVVVIVTMTTIDIKLKLSTLVIFF